MTEYFLNTFWAAGIGMCWEAYREMRRLGEAGRALSATPVQGGKVARRKAAEAARERLSGILRAANRGGYFFGAVAAAFGACKILEVPYGGFSPGHYAAGGVLGASAAVAMRGVPGRKLRGALFLSAGAAGVGYVAGLGRAWLDEKVEEQRAALAAAAPPGGAP